MALKPGSIIRKALEEEVRRRLLEELDPRAKKLRDKLLTISDEEIAGIIRMDRDA